MQDKARRLGGILAGAIYRQRRASLVLVSYGLISAVMTWPLIARLGTLVPAGVGGDVWSHLWTFWWVKKSLAEGINPFYTSLLYFPEGVSLTTHNIAWVNIAIWLPLQAILGGYPAYSLIYVAIFALNGFAMYLLVREWTESLPAAFIGGVIFGFWPFTLSQSGHPNTVLVCWMPLALLHLRRVLVKGRNRDAVLAGVSFALLGLTLWRSLIMGGVITGLFLLYAILTDRSTLTWSTLGRLALVGLVTVGLTAPLAAPVVAAQLGRAHPEDTSLYQPETGQTDLLAYLLPSRHLTLWGDTAIRLFEDYKISTVQVPFLGYTTILLALYGTVRRWRSSRFWVLAAGLYIVLALGAQLRFNGQLYPRVPMPYRLIDDVFFVTILRKASRFNVLVGLPLGMLASFGMEALLRHRHLGRKPALLAGVVGIVILCEYCTVPYRTAQPVTPAWYSQLSREPGDLAVLDLPMDPRYADKWYMLYQITHGKPLVEGHVSRQPRELFAFLDSTPFLKKLHEDNVMDPALMDATRQLEPLVEGGVRYIILHKQFASAEQLAAWRDWLTFEPDHEDTDLVVYRTDPRPGRDFALAHEMAQDVGLISAAFTSDEGTGLIHVDARWGTVTAPGRDFDACLKLVDVLGEIVESACQPLSATLPASRWDAGEVVRGSYRIQVGPLLGTGPYSVTLQLAESDTGAKVGTEATVGRLE